MTRESMEFDVVIVGGGPGGLAAACRLMQLSQRSGHEISVCVIEKGSEIGAHILSGAVFEPRALNELFPDWRERGAPLNTPVTEDDVYYLVNDTNGIQRAELARAEGDAQPRQLRDQSRQPVPLARRTGRGARRQSVSRIRWGRSVVQRRRQRSRRRDRRHGRRGRWQPQADVSKPATSCIGKYTIFAEGCRGNLGKQLIKKFDLDRGAATQHYAIGLKELWDLDPRKARPRQGRARDGLAAESSAGRIFRRISCTTSKTRRPSSA